MACQAIHSWTFSTLIASYLDLSITYLLLCASTLAFFTSKFLSLFNLNLPCPCNGLFITDNPRRNCLQRYLIDSPIKKISSVQKSVINKFPFDSILMNDHQGSRHVIAKLIENKDRCDELMEGESSECGSFVLKKNELVRFGSLNSGFVAKGFDDLKGKGGSNQRVRPGSLRRRRGNRLVRRVSGLSNSRIGQETVETAQNEASSVSTFLEDKTAQNGGSSVSTYSEGDDSKHDNAAQVGINSDEGLQHSFRWNDMNGESKKSERDESSASDVVQDVQHEMPLGQSDGNAIRVLEQALEEEHAARAALYQELEKERSAAASAADEAMAMILRLQKEKASTEMEARQYQRMIKEKSAYDQEEMNILKEILLRREKEKHFLEKEVEAYRHMMNPEKEEFAGMSVQRPRMSFDSSDDPALMLQQLSEYIDKKKMVENMKNASGYDPLPVEKYGRVLDFGDEYPSPSWYEIEGYLKQEEDRRSPSIEKHHMGPESRDKSKQELQEKGSLSAEEYPSVSDIHGQVSGPHSGFPKSSGSSESQEQISFEKNIVVNEELGKNDNAARFHDMDVKSDQTCKNEISFPCDGAYLEKDGNGADQDALNHHSSILEREPAILDVHVIDPNSTSCSHGSEKVTKPVLMNPATHRFRKFGPQPEASCLRKVSNSHPGTSMQGQAVIHRSMSDMQSLSDDSQGKILFSDMRRNSLSSVDYEKIKLESEVGCLRERLKMVQEGREKLSFSVEHRERENLHLQLLDDIARQLREIRHLTAPEKAVRQASLPPSSSKVSSKKRRCRSVSLGLHGSS